MTEQSFIQEMVRFAKAEWDLSDNEAWTLANAWRDSCKKRSPSAQERPALSKRTTVSHLVDQGLIEVMVHRSRDTDPKEVATRFLDKRGIEGTPSLIRATSPFPGFTLSVFKITRTPRPERKLTREEVMALLADLG